MTLAPETGSKSSTGGMGALAAMAGINIGSSSGEDALSPELYPDIVSSTPFLLEMFDVKVTDQKGKINTTLYEYLDKHQRSPWWGAIASAPFKALGWVVSLFKDTPEELGDAKINPFCLTPDQAGIADALSHRISVSVDKKTGVTTLSVTMQDPLISAALTDTVMHCLQNYITDYRTNKARHDLAFTEKLFDDAQGNTPVYTVVQPATVPLRPAKPNKIMILIGFVFLAGVGSIGWILFVKDLLNGWKKQPEK